MTHSKPSWLSTREIHRMPGELTLHPLCLICLSLWILNDHYGKGAWPPIISGKLSDIVSLIVAPLIATGLFEVAHRLSLRHILQASMSEIEIHASRQACLYFTLFAASLMIGINISPAWAEIYQLGLAVAQWPFRLTYALCQGAPVPDLGRVALTMDASDLYCVPSAYLALFIHQRVYPMNQKSADSL